MATQLSPSRSRQPDRRSQDEKRLEHWFVAKWIALRADTHGHARSLEV